MVAAEQDGQGMVSAQVGRLKWEGNKENEILKITSLSRDDPRMPTVRALQRRGLTAEALKEFIIAQHSSGSTKPAKWNLLWSINQRIMGQKTCR